MGNSSHLLAGGCDYDLYLEPAHVQVGYGLGSPWTGVDTLYIDNGDSLDFRFYYYAHPSCNCSIQMLDIYRNDTIVQTFSNGGWISGNYYFSLSTPGYYQIGGSNGCGILRKFYIAPNAVSSSIDELDPPTSFDFFVYPVPAKQQITVWFQASESITTEITIQDITGQTVLTKGISGKGILEGLFDLGLIPSGLYFISIRLNGTIRTKKFIKV